MPPIRAELRDKRAASGGPQLDDRAAGAECSRRAASASFNSAEVDVPKGGDELTVTLGGSLTAKLLKFQ